MQILAGVGSSEQLPTPILSAATATYGGFTFTITNYNASNGYTITTTAGSVSRSGSTVTQSGLSNGASATVTIYSTRAGFTNSFSATSVGTAIPTCTNTGYSYTTVNGGNCGTCGIIPCGTGHVPAYDTLWVQVTPVPCMSGATVVPGGYTNSNGSWYCLNVGLTCGVPPCP
jgi:hypothetical protein